MAARDQKSGCFLRKSRQVSSVRDERRASRAAYQVFVLGFIGSLIGLSFAWAGSGRVFSWDSPKPIDPNTTLLTEIERTPKEIPGQPKSTDKSYAWYCLEKGNRFLADGDKAKAAAFFREAYQTPSPARVISGFKLVDTLDEMGLLEEAIRVLEEMNDKFLVSTREYGEAKKVRMRLEDKKRLLTSKVSTPIKMSGKDWLYQVSTWRNEYTLQAMDVLRKYEIPMMYPAYHYTFLMDEYFLKNPDASADNGAEVLAGLIYQENMAAREAIDRWRQNPSAPPSPIVAAKLVELEGKMRGSDWVRMVHHDKMKYVSEAMEVLKKQGVPMQKSNYAYVYAVDDLFTDKPELPANDSVVALATILYETEPEARRILEALRLES